MVKRVFVVIKSTRKSWREYVKVSHPPEYVVSFVCILSIEVERVSKSVVGFVLIVDWYPYMAEGRPKPGRKFKLIP